MFIGAIVYHFNSAVYQFTQSTGVNYIVPQFGTTTSGQLETTIFFVGATIVSTFLLAFFIGRSRKRLPQAVACLMGISVYGSISSGLFAFVPQVFLYGFAAISFCLYLAVAWGKANPYFAIPFISLLTVGLSMTILVFFPTWTPLLIPLVLAAWDIYAVFRGPLKRIVTGDKPSRLLSLLVARVGSTSIGLGDLVAYTLLVLFAIARFGSPVPLAVGIAIVAGLGVTIWLLRTNRLKAIPALPIPVALAMIPIGMALFL